MSIKKQIKVLIWTLISLLIISATLSVWFPLLQALRLVFGSVFILFLPGFFILEVAFSRNNINQGSHNIDWIERVTLSIALSIAVVPLLVYGFNKLGMKIDAQNIMLSVLVFILILMIIIAGIYKKQTK